MKYIIKIPIEPISINKVHCRDQRYYTAKFRHWATDVLRHLDNDHNKKEIKEISEAFNPKQHYFKIQIATFYPRKQMFTQTCTISSKTHDVSNIEKPLIDVVFTPKFNGFGTLKGNNINIDDKYIKEMTSVQRAADNHLIEFTIEIRNLEEIDSEFI